MIRLTVNYVDAKLILTPLVRDYGTNNYSSDPHMLHKVYWVGFFNLEIHFEAH